jgi:S1-C subfamily serine protease
VSEIHDSDVSKILRNMKIKIILIMLLGNMCFSNINAQCDRNYFINNFTDLDLIEGIWSANISIYIENIYTGEKSSINEFMDIGEFSIKRNNGSYTAKHCMNSEWEIDIRGTASSNLFIFNGPLFSNNIYIKTEFFVTGKSVIDFIYECSERQEEEIFLLIDLDGDQNSKIFELSIRFKWIKVFPDSKTINEIINKESSKSFASGFAISNDGYIITCYHVINGANNIFIRGIGGNFNKRYKANIVKFDKNNDIAIIKPELTTPLEIDNIPYAISDNLTDIGENIFTLGFPLKSTMGEEIKLSKGIISSLSGFRDDITSYQISVPIQPGNSGGPLFDYDGNLVGIISAFHDNTDNVSYAIKSEYLLSLLKQSHIDFSLGSLSNIPELSLSELVKKVKSFIYIIEVE